MYVECYYTNSTYQVISKMRNNDDIGNHNNYVSYVENSCYFWIYSILILRIVSDTSKKTIDNFLKEGVIINECG